MTEDGFIPPHGGFEELVTYQKAQLIFQATHYLTKKWIRVGSRTRDQMEQAARSGKQNIVEGSLAAGTSSQTEIHLTNVAKASLGELLEDFRDFLLIRHLPQWVAEDPRAQTIRNLAQAGEKPTYEKYQPHIESEDPEIMANTMICLINQTCFLLKRQIQRLERDFLKDGGIRERMTQARLHAREKQQALPEATEPSPACPLCAKPMRQRKAKTGANAGKPFWGCSSFPECRGTREMKA